MKTTSILFVSMLGIPYKELEKRILNTKNGSYKDFNTNAGNAQPLGLLYLSAYIKKKFPTSVQQFIANYVEMEHEMENYDSVDDFIVNIGSFCYLSPIALYCL